MNWIVKIPKYIVNKLSQTYRATIDAIKNFKVNPVDNVRDILFGITLIIVLLSLVVSFVLFTAQGGYIDQITAIKGGGLWSGADAGLRIGDRALELFYNGLLWNAGLALIVIQIIFLIFSSFWNGGLLQRIILAIDLVFALILGLCAAVYQGINRRIIPLSPEQEAQAVELFQRYGQTAITVFFALCAVAGIIFIIITLIDADCRIGLKYIVISAAILYLACPAILFILAHIIPLVAAIIFGLIISGLLGFLALGLVSSGEGASPAPKSTQKSSKPKSQVKPWTIPSGIKVRKVHGVTHDYVERYNLVDGCSEVCSLNDLRNGKFVIIDPRKGRLTERDIPWKEKN